MRLKPLPVVAILDEDDDDQFLLRQAFEQCRQDIEVRCFGKSAGLIEYLNRHKNSRGISQAADLAILGLHLPWEGAFDFIAALKSSPGLRQIPIIVLIGPMPDALVRRLYELGANTVITRPILWDELITVLKKTCDYWFGPLEM